MGLRQQQILSGLGTIALVAIMRGFGWLQVAELSVYDAFLRGRRPEPVDPRVVLVEIDEAAIDTLGGYPLDPAALPDLLAALTEREPLAIGLNLAARDLLDFQPDGDLARQLKGAEQLVVIEKAFRPFNYPLLDMAPTDRVGFSDVLRDRDGSIRRLLLGSPPDGSYRDPEARYLLSFPTRLAKNYLAARNLPLENGRRDRSNMRFGTVELPRLVDRYGGVVDDLVQDVGTQVLFDPRAGRSVPVPRFTWDTAIAREIPPAALNGRVVLVGISDRRHSETYDVPALGQRLGSLELQAHAVSQILSSVLDRRPLLHVWPLAGELLWIGAWGGLGIVLGFIVPARLGLFGRPTNPSSPAPVLVGNFGLVALALGGLTVSSYGLLLWVGVWVPVVPAALALVANGLLPIPYALYRYNRDLRDRLKEASERERTLEETFNLIHNGPLQRLALLLRGIRDDKLMPADIAPELERLNHEIRQIVRDLAPETSSGRADTLRLGSGQLLDLSQPLHELFNLVYQSTLERDFPGFAALKLQVRNFAPVNDERLAHDRKRQLCQFLEESLCNVGKHARQPSRLEVIGRPDGDRLDWYQLKISDNGAGAPSVASISGGSGTRQAQKLAARLKGKFSRQPRSPQGTICQLSWPQGGNTFQKRS